MFAQKILIAFLDRALAVLVAGTLAACAGTGTETTPVAAVSRAPVAAGRGQTPPPQPPAPPAEPALSPADALRKARAECWMKMENDKKAPREPEKRLPLVEKCVQQKLNAPPLPAPATQAPQ